MNEVEVRAGIHSIGIHLPEKVRTNDWWPQDVVQSWRQRRQAIEQLGEKRQRRTVDPGEAALSEAVRVVIELMQDQGDDPFLGVRERRVIDAGKRSIDMELDASRKAIEAAGIDRSQIDFLFVNSGVPEDLNAPSSCLLHRELGLRESCFSLNTQVACVAFLSQLILADQLLRSGHACWGLLVNSATASAVVDPAMPLSCIFGDGAAAVVVGPATGGRGVLGFANGTDGSFFDVLRLGSPGKQWYEAGPSVLFSRDVMAGRRMLLHSGEVAKRVVDAALKMAGYGPDEVDFLAAHQGTVWFVEMVRRACRLSRAQTLSTFEWTGNLSSVNLPVVLSEALREGLLADGDLVAMHAGGSGISYSGVVIRWGV